MIVSHIIMTIMIMTIMIYIVATSIGFIMIIISSYFMDFSTSSLPSSLPSYPYSYLYPYSISTPSPSMYLYPYAYGCAWY